MRAGTGPDGSESVRGGSTGACARSGQRAQVRGAGRARPYLASDGLGPFFDPCLTIEVDPCFTPVLPLDKSGFDPCLTTWFEPCFDPCFCLCFTSGFDSYLTTGPVPCLTLV